MRNALLYLDALAFPREPRQTPHQRLWLRAALRHLYTWWEGSRGSAKTYSAARLLHLLCSLFRLRVVVAAPTFRQAKLLFREMKRLRAASMFLREEIPEKNIREGAVDTAMDFSNGSTVVCVPASGFKTHGHRADLVVFTEAAGLPKSLYADAVWPMLFQGETEAKVLWETAAGTIADYAHQERERVVAEQAKGNPEYALLPFTIYDLEAEGFPVRVKAAEELKKIDEPAFAQMALNVWRQFSERLFPYSAMFREELQTGEIHRGPKDGWRYFGGFDVAGVRVGGRSGAAAAFVLIGWDGIGAPAVVSAFEWENLSHDQQAKRAADLLSRFRVERVEMDVQTVGGPVYRELSRLGYVLDEEEKDVPGQRIVRRAPHTNETIDEMMRDLQGAVLSGAIQFPATPEAEDLTARFEAARKGMAQLCDLDAEEHESGRLHFVKKVHKRYDVGYAMSYAYRAYREATKPAGASHKKVSNRPEDIIRGFRIWEDEELW